MTIVELDNVKTYYFEMIANLSDTPMEVTITMESELPVYSALTTRVREENEWTKMVK